MKALILTLLLTLISGSVYADMRQYPKDRLVGDEVYQLCTLIKKGEDIGRISANIVTMAQRRELPIADFLNNVLTKESCTSLGPKGATVVTQAMYFHHDNLEPFFTNGWDLRRKIPDFDGVLREPLEIAWRKFLRGEKSGNKHGSNKVQWGKVSAAISGAGQLSDEYKSDIRERVKKEFVQEVLAEAGDLPANQLTQPELNALCTVGQVRFELLTASMLKRAQSVDIFIDKVLRGVQCQGEPYPEKYVAEFRELHNQAQ